MSLIQSLFRIDLADSPLRRGRYRPVCVPIMLGLFLISFVQVGFTQDKTVLTQEQWETGFHAFAQVIRKRGVEITSNYENWREYPAQQRILILLGSISSIDQAYLSEFVAAGGSALLATDIGFGPVQVDRHEIRIHQGGSVHARYSGDQYRGISGWTIISKLDREEPVFDGINQIVPNFPALLEVRPRLNNATGWKTIARYPTLQSYGSNLPFMVRFDSPRGGKLLVVPDHSLFVNGSVVADDNLRFMLNAIDWLREDNRSRCLFVLNGTPIEPPNVSNVDLYTTPPGAAETRRMLEELWRRTSTRDKVDLANEVLELAQEEQLLEQIVDAINLDEIIPPNQMLKWGLFLAAWCGTIAFVVILVSNRKKPLQSQSADGLKSHAKKELARREKVERSRAAEALFVHFFNRLGIPIRSPSELDVDLITGGNHSETKRLRKNILKIRNDLTRQPMDYWTDGRVEEVGRYIAQWSNLSETGLFNVDSSATDANINN